MFEIGQTVVTLDTQSLRFVGIANCEAVIVGTPPELTGYDWTIRMQTSDGGEPDPRNEFGVFGHEIREL